jgi:hypothetical protein
MGVSVRTSNGIWLYWKYGWPMWRYGTRFPEEIGVMENRDVQYRMNFPDTLVGE